MDDLLWLINGWLWILRIMVNQDLLMIMDNSLPRIMVAYHGYS